jgi:hypothetical protein
LSRDDVEKYSRDNTGHSPLSWAVARVSRNALARVSPNVQIIELLTSSEEVDIYSQDSNYRSPYHWAIMYVNQRLVCPLCGALPPSTGFKDSETPILVDMAQIPQHTWLRRTRCGLQVLVHDVQATQLRGMKRLNNHYYDHLYSGDWDVCAFFNEAILLFCNGVAA